MAERILSIFFDESGDQGLTKSQSPFYILSMVFHDQSRDISEHISNFDTHLERIGQNNSPIHTGPLIRKEFPYAMLNMETRKKLFVSLMNFMRRTGVRYGIISFDKRVECSKEISPLSVILEH